ncbi:MAG: prephenate dehydratase [Desulfobacterales bacterium RIFOXYA12_FULL_46_15]|nr:MAG: prephenate dehydratase [Desulfobacula sp. GWF2_41_7]OGR27745.1 MAG: prephenate dehydratase [Desulfobacterales bacterium RIFOXYA12_FULL_46_15]
MVENDLKNLRDQIDDIDSKILNLINQRLEIGKKVGLIKKETGSRILDRTRERSVIEKLSKINQGPADKQLLKYFFNVIIKATRDIQRPKTISYLGPEASHSHIAALTYFRHSGKFVEQPNLYEIFREVEKNESHFGIVPVENSIEGAVTHTLDLFSNFDLYICAEHYEPVSHDLLSITGEPQDVQKICSHPQALAQCRSWIKKKFGHTQMIETGSTAKAALLASEDKNIAAIASKQAAHIYALQTVESKIEDHSGNITRFLVIGKELPEPSGNDKTSIMFATSHIPGALFKAIEPIDRAGLNMLKLESRPTHHQNWSYYFFLDIEGHQQDQRLIETINEIKKYSLSLKILGSYPVFEKEDYEA